MDEGGCDAVVTSVLFIRDEESEMNETGLMRRVLLRGLYRLGVSAVYFCGGSGTWNTGLNIKLSFLYSTTTFFTSVLSETSIQLEIIRNSKNRSFKY